MIARETLAALGLAAAALIVRLVWPDDSTLYFAMLVMVWSIFALGYDISFGLTGLLSFGHAAFFGMAAYVTGHAVKVWGWPTEVGILAGTVVAALLGLVFGLIAIRRQGIYFAMITLALAQMVFFFSLQAPFTGGEDGIQAIPRRPILGFLNIQNDLTFYYVVLAIFLFGFAVIYRTVHSPFGQVLKAIRENEPRAVSLGYKVDRYKLLAFVLSTALAGLAGSTKAIVFQLASLTDVHWGMSGEVVLMTLVGGIGTILGPVVGAAIIVAMQNYLASIGEWVLVVQGIVFVVIVMAFRKGIVGEIAERLKKRFAA
jgi:branched-chain amino acid transport system permease protein